MCREWMTVVVPLLASGWLQVTGPADTDLYPYPQSMWVPETPADLYSDVSQGGGCIIGPGIQLGICSRVVDHGWGSI